LADINSFGSFGPKKCQAKNRDNIKTPINQHSDHITGEWAEEKSHPGFGYGF
jgi:hypothetical protein